MHHYPVFKKGGRYRAESYRPVSLTSITCKVREHVIVSAIRDFVEQQNILHLKQHSFCRVILVNHSYWGLKMRLLRLWRETARWMSSSWIFQRCFLIHKLCHYNIQGKLNLWIKQFLGTGDSQCQWEDPDQSFLQYNEGYPRVQSCNQPCSCCTLMTFLQASHPEFSSLLMTRSTRKT